jgi:hypothetical protein
VFICLYLRLKKDNLLTADEKGLTQIHADKEKRYMKNSRANRFDIIPNSQRWGGDNPPETLMG